MGLGSSFATETPLGLSPGAGSTTTLTSGTTKLNHAQAELQACELHLAAKEKELESTREEAIKKGLEKRLKALISCGWAWGERGKQALRALEPFGGDHANGGKLSNLFLLVGLQGVALPNVDVHITLLALPLLAYSVRLYAVQITDSLSMIFIL